MRRFYRECHNRFVNRLAHEQSPYLLQHANNPVDWFPWGDEAFAKARAEDKPIFLSIGYSTCHWCHVMEHESFEAPSVAAVLNEHFVSIKVDREERPDVDRVYMAFVQGTTGSGGWPMSVWLTPELKPFYGGTYFPPTSRYQRPGFLDILGEIARVWQSDRQKINESAESVTRQLQAAERVDASSIPGAEALDDAVNQFRRSFDARYGGFGQAPKFPRPSELLFLLREYARTGESEPRAMALRTLRAMALGGVRDHIGGGFHRYSVDEAWRVPHFEKMLYDQAQLVLAYAEAAQASGDPFYMAVAEDTLAYVMREMTDAAGGFYSAEDADSVPPEQAGHAQPHKAEGAFYLWTASELRALLGDEPEAVAVVNRRFGIQEQGNAPIDPQQEFAGKNLLYVAASVEELASEFGKPAGEIDQILARARLRMFEERLTRPRPHLDDKVLTAWNGLMIAAFARVARIKKLSNPGNAVNPYLAAARRAAAFLRDRMWNPETTTLLRRYRDGEAAIEGYAEDYAFLIYGLIELLQADPDPAWLEWALALQRRQNELFRDEANGGWFSTSGRDPSVLVRMKDDYDGAEPSVSSVSVLNLLVLSHLVDEEGWRDDIDRTLRFFGDRLRQLGRGVPMMEAALSTYVAGPQQIVIVSAGDALTAQPLTAVVSTRYLPFAVILSLSDAERRSLAGRLPFLEAMQPVSGQPAAYICSNFTCRPPITSAAALEAELADE
jgi:uncharacterized protein YyaL (SSP411 family)